MELMIVMPTDEAFHDKSQKGSKSFRAGGGNGRRRRDGSSVPIPLPPRHISSIWMFACVLEHTLSEETGKRSS